MKKALIIIPTNMYQRVKNALTQQGFNGFSRFDVLDRGEEAVSGRMTGSRPLASEPLQLRFIPKKMMMLVIADDEEARLVQTVKAIHGLSHDGVGKIVIIPVKESIRIRTGEFGIEAIV